MFYSFEVVVFDNGVLFFFVVFCSDIWLFILYGKLSVLVCGNFYDIYLCFFWYKFSKLEMFVLKCGVLNYF